ncbi:MAG: hypothetical protein ACYTE5_00525 [Planctomycetota bacterium]|jgi:hypothetical protein
MEARKKNRIMISIIVVCFATVGVMAYSRFSKRKPDWKSIPAHQKVWLLCSECESPWQMGTRAYFEYLAEHQNPLSMEPPGVLCGGCGEEGGYRAEKCGKCGLIFRRGLVPHDFADRCPKCGFSGTEESRRESGSDK